MGETYGPALARSLHREAQAVLRQFGHENAKIGVASTPEGMRVQIELAKGPQRVRQLVLELD